MSDLVTTLQTRGAVLVEVDGVSTAARFGEAAAESAALRERAGVVDWPWWGRLRVTGSDRVPFLQGMLSNDVQKLVSGAGCQALLLSEQGRAVADLVVVATDDAIVLAGHASALASARVALERFIVADDVEIVDDVATRALAVLGPDARGVLERLGIAVPSAPYGQARATLDGTALDLVRLPSPGAGGFLCFVPSASAAHVWTSLTDAGAAPVGYAAFDAFRIEHGVPWHGRDVTAETLALEAPYEAAISFRKGCYLGQEVMERVTARGHVNRKLVGLALAGDVVPAAQSRVFAGDRDVGWVTSAAWSPRLGQPIALAYVRREHVDPGTALAVGEAPQIAATVRAWPL